MSENLFSNDNVPSHHLPDLAELAFEPISPVYRKVNLGICVAIISVLMIMALVIRFQALISVPPPLFNASQYALVIVPLIGVLFCVYQWFADKQVMFALREQDLSLKQGLIFRRLASQPVLRIQHVELKRGPLDRLSGLAKLQVFSAGGAGHTFEIPGLPIARAQKIRQFILTHKDIGAR
ncbi:PH domain-containing protein [Alteromonas sp. C1M14]|uniref:PH domain-containing protein n=1 Tax=Alteromonas sp. C1M14 TaxID=2841567 RepID=UPI001C09BFE6|nr:PH domain-containing protein [Alteromonas sp. C1M14]MBU2979488.1 PH domain-containing protein [Alteromonas sp. C1M14]